MNQLRLGYLNSVMLIGRLVADPELRYTQKGAPVCDFRIASSRRYKNRETGEQQEETLFIPKHYPFAEAREPWLASFLIKIRSMAIPATPARTNSLLARINAVDSFLTKMVEGKAAFQLSPSCEMLRKGFIGEYKRAAPSSKTSPSQGEGDTGNRVK